MAFTVGFGHPHPFRPRLIASLIASPRANRAVGQTALAVGFALTTLFACLGDLASGVPCALAMMVAGGWLVVRADQIARQAA